MTNSQSIALLQINKSAEGKQRETVLCYTIDCSEQAASSFKKMNPYNQTHRATIVKVKILISSLTHQNMTSKSDSYNSHDQVCFHFSWKHHLDFFLD